MKRLGLRSATLVGTLVATTGMVVAADLGRRGPTVNPVPVMAPVPYFNWSGLYVGAHAGYGWGSKEWSDVGPFSSHDIDGFIGGGQVGYNFQVGQIVFGVEGDLSGTRADGASQFAGQTFESRVDWVATLTGRLGYAANNWLFYAKGGAAWANDEFLYSRGGFAGGVGETRTGWTVGAGVEVGFAPNWSAKLEYNYMDFGNDRASFGPGDAFNIDQQMHVVKAGINYRFGWGGPPVAARY